MTEDDVWHWPEAMWDRYRAFADLWLERNNWKVSGG